jgi:hypothetical protein
MDSLTTGHVSLFNSTKLNADYGNVVEIDTENLEVSQQLILTGATITGLTADSVNETATRVFVSPAQRTQIGTNATAISQLQSDRLKLDGSLAMAGNLNMNENKIVSKLTGNYCAIDFDDIKSLSKFAVSIDGGNSYVFSVRSYGIDITTPIDLQNILKVNSIYASTGSIISLLNDVSLSNKNITTIGSGGYTIGQNIGSATLYPALTYTDTLYANTIHIGAVGQNMALINYESAPIVRFNNDLTTTFYGNVLTSFLVDGRDISTDGKTQDDHIADSTIHFTVGSIDHKSIQNIGTNTHAQIDTHIASTSNPHSVTASQLSDYNTVWDARLATKTTTNLSEGTNLYYTEARVNANTLVAGALQRSGGTMTGAITFSGLQLFNTAQEAQVVYNTTNISGTDKRLIRSSGTNFASIQQSGVTLDDSSNMSGLMSLTSQYLYGQTSASGVMSVSGTRDIVNTNSTVTFIDPLDATSSTSASVIMSGGLAVAKKAYIGTNLNVGSTMTCSVASCNSISASGTTTCPYLYGSSSASGTLTICGTSHTTSAVASVLMTETTTSTSTTTGTLVVSGGVGIAGNLYCKAINTGSSGVNAGSGAITCGALTSTTITTNNNTINAGTGALTCGALTSTTITTNNNTINAGTGALTCGALTSTTITTNNNTINAGTGALTCGALTSTTITTNNNTINAGTGALTCGALTATTVNASATTQLVSSGTSANIVSGTTGAITTQGDIHLYNGTKNQIAFRNVGVGAPAFTTRSVGSKLVLFPQIGASAVDYAIGIESSNMWFSTPDATSYGFKWYGGTSSVMSLTSAGNLTTVGTIYSNPPYGTLLDTDIVNNTNVAETSLSLNFSAFGTNRIWFIGVGGSGGSLCIACNGGGAPDPDIKFAVDSNAVTYVASLNVKDDIVYPTPCCEAYATGNTTTTTFTATSTFVRTSYTTVSSGHIQNFTVDNSSNKGRLTYTGARTRMFHTGTTFSLSCASVNQQITCAMYKNGTLAPGSKVDLYLGTASVRVSTAIHKMLSMATNDYFELWVSNNTSTGAITVTEMNIFCMGLTNTM